MISTTITRLFPLPISPGGSASVDVNTEIGCKFIDVIQECGTAPLSLPGGQIKPTFNAWRPRQIVAATQC
jgi:hypothetical protein